MEYWKVAAYYRISNDDGDLMMKGKEESNSISNQRNLIQDYLIDKKEFRLCKERIDDGFSGVDFQRPGFQEMMQDIQNGIINCIIVKDLSRFGRNYIETGRYLQKIFPLLGVRFIAVIDEYDSSSVQCQCDYITLPFKNLMNDAYSRDISVKVRSQLEVKQKKGEFIGAFAPYGYEKEESNHNHLQIDPYAAEIVQIIFKWKLAGKSNDGIAKQLNSLNILSPYAYKKSNGMKYDTGYATTKKTMWSALSIKRILTNEVYLGHMLQGKRTTLSYKVKKVIEKPKDLWVRIEHTHEAIIEAREFELVQKILLRDTRVAPDHVVVYPFSGLIICGLCGEYMVRKTMVSNHHKYHYFICSGYKQNVNTCKSYLLSEKSLNELLLTLLARLYTITCNEFKLERALVVRFIDKIIVLNKNHIKITFNFIYNYGGRKVV